MIEETLNILSNGSRREITYNLLESESEELHIRDLEKFLVEETDIESNRVYLELVHMHLPKMEEHGIINYDRDRGIVAYDADETVEDLISQIRELEQRYGDSSEL